jgi:hypothetical protein
MVLRGRLRGRVGRCRGLFFGVFVNDEHPFYYYKEQRVAGCRHYGVGEKLFFSQNN